MKLTKIIRKFPIIIAPSILSADFANLYPQCDNILKLGADSLDIDIMDGHFVPNLTIGPPVIQSLMKKLTNAHFYCHLMVTHPQNYIEALQKAKINCLTFHIQSQYSELKKVLIRLRRFAPKSKMQAWKQVLVSSQNSNYQITLRIYQIASY